MDMAKRRDNFVEIATSRFVKGLKVHEESFGTCQGIVVSMFLFLLFCLSRSCPH